MRGLYARYNEQINGIDVTDYNSGITLRLDCNKWERGLRTTENSQRMLDALAIDDPLEYVRLSLSGELQDWVNDHDNMRI